MQICGDTSLSLRFPSDFLVSTECKALFAVASRHHKSDAAESDRNLLCWIICSALPAWCSNFSKLPDSIVDIYSSASHCLK